MRIDNDISLMGKTINALSNGDDDDNDSKIEFAIGERYRYFSRSKNHVSLFCVCFALLQLNIGWFVVRTVSI